MIRRLLRRVAALLFALALASPTLAADAKPAGGKPEGGKPEGKSAADTTAAPVVTQHEVTVNGHPLKYKVTTGKLPIRNEQGETEAEIFFMAYTVDHTGGPESRPLMFSFNGGP